MDLIMECKALTKVYTNQIALSNVNLQIGKGRIVGLLGPNGSGKTTLIKLTNGLLTPTHGEILIDGTEIKNMPRKSLRHSYGMVLQDTWLKNGIVKENIAYGKPDVPTVKLSPPQRLSAGEMQLLSIARVIL